jgi:transcription-repair coupling factor (superfamily II helicase)
MRHEFDVFVCTTIVENGLDIPLANTIVIDKAENYGLSELYQLRGRVGRSNRRAYAYLLVEEGKELSSTARKRLAALKEFSELGSGFKIAALDLELRGAGNLLGAEQHGHIAAVGFETYCRLLEDTMRKLQGEDVEEAVRSSLKLQLDVHIPPDYIGDEIQRLQVYKRLAEIRTDADAERIRGELRDRYGPAPPAVSNLIEYALLKSRAEQLRIESIERRRTQWTLRFRGDSKVDAKRLMQFVAATPGASFSPQGVLLCELNGLESPLNTLKKLLEQLAPELPQA